MDLVTVDEVARLLKVDRDTVTLWCRKGKFPPGATIKTPGGQWRVRWWWLRGQLGD